MLLALDDGLVNGNLSFADVCFLIATILFAIGFVVRLLARPLVLDGVLIAAGLTAVALGWLVL